jgi:hypothetical protein
VVSTEQKAAVVPEVSRPPGAAVQVRVDVVAYLVQLLADPDVERDELVAERPQALVGPASRHPSTGRAARP